jgi:transposase
MRKIKEVLRLHHEMGLSARQIAKSCHIARSTAKEYLDRAQRAGLTWPLSSELDDAQLENLLFPPTQPIAPEKRHMPPMEYLYQELKKKAVTLQVLWCEYKQANPEGYQYSQFCKLYHEWVSKLDVCLRQEYRAGEKLFVDYAGQTIPVQNPLTGQIQEAYLFVATLGASHYTFAEASFSQDLPSWISSHIHAFEFFGGIPEILIPDNLKAAATHPSRYEPDLNPTYRDLAEYYGTVVIPARVGKPRDKAKVEWAVLLVERWILAALRNHTFFSLAELNQTIARKLDELNHRPFQKLNTSRRALFENLEKPALKPLPEKPYEYAEWRKARVNIDYHIEVDHHYYSVPYQLIKEQVDVRLTSSTIEILFKNRRVASYARSYQKGKFTTLQEHLSKAHHTYLEWTPSRIIRWSSPFSSLGLGILRTNLDGSNPELVLAHDGDVHGMDFGPFVPLSTPIPEPATIFLLGSGILGLAGLRKVIKKLILIQFSKSEGRVRNGPAFFMQICNSNHYLLGLSESEE